MTGEENNSFEALLGNVLQDYGKAEPRAGMERRILTCVQLEHASKDRNPFWRYIAIASSLIALALFIALHQRDLSSTQKPIEKAVMEASPTVVSPLLTVHKAEVRIFPIAGAAKAESPMQSVFPAPTAPAVEGLRFAEWSQQHPQEASHLLALQQEDSATEALKIEPIRIAAIEVSPIDTPTVDQGDSQ